MGPRELGGERKVRSAFSLSERPGEAERDIWVLIRCRFEWEVPFDTFPSCKGIFGIILKIKNSTRRIFVIYLN